MYNCKISGNTEWKRAEIINLLWQGAVLEQRKKIRVCIHSSTCQVALSLGPGHTPRWRTSNMCISDTE